MKLLVLADLHLDEIADPEYLRCLGEAIHDAGQEAEALIVAGDIAEDAAEKWPQALNWLGSLYPAEKTLIIPGNHDYYGGNLSMLDAQLDLICRDAGCRFGQCKRMALNDVRVLMATLWTDMKLFEGNAGHSIEDLLWQAQMMPDYGDGVITVTEKGRSLCPEDTIAMHEEHKVWLMSELQRPWNGRTIVVTPHAPSGMVAGAMTQLSPCFASDLEAEIEKFRPDFWLFGHTHRLADLRMPSGTLLRNVSIGYEDELHPDDLVTRVRRGLIELGPMSED